MSDELSESDSEALDAYLRNRLEKSEWRDSDTARKWVEEMKKEIAADPEKLEKTLKAHEALQGMSEKEEAALDWWVKSRLAKRFVKDEIYAAPDLSEKMPLPLFSPEDTKKDEYFLMKDRALRAMEEEGRGNYIRESVSQQPDSLKEIVEIYSNPKRKAHIDELYTDQYSMPSYDIHFEAEVIKEARKVREAMQNLPKPEDRPLPMQPNQTGKSGPLI